MPGRNEEAIEPYRTVQAVSVAKTRPVKRTAAGAELADLGNQGRVFGQFFHAGSGDIEQQAVEGADQFAVGVPGRA